MQFHNLQQVWVEPIIRALVIFRFVHKQLLQWWMVSFERICSWTLPSIYYILSTWLLSNQKSAGSEAQSETTQWDHKTPYLRKQQDKTTLLNSNNFSHKNPFCKMVLFLSSLSWHIPARNCLNLLSVESWFANSCRLRYQHSFSLLQSYQ